MFVLLEWQIPVETFLPLIFHQLHQIGVDRRMKVEDGGKRGVTRPFWCLVAFHPAGDHRCEAIGNGFDEGRPTCRMTSCQRSAA